MTAHIYHELIVDLGERSYPIQIGAGLITDPERIRSYLAGRQVLVVTNDKIAPLYLNKVCDALADLNPDRLVLPDGEEHKSFKSLITILNALVEGGHHRTTTVLALGGGVIGDLAGFAAACYQRGVAFIQLPTTLLAQVDSSVGGKTAINHEAGKNLIGAFHQPRLVLIDLDVLTTLPDREYGAGLAELVKHALIHDAVLFAWLEEHAGTLRERNIKVLAEALYRSVRIKAEIVAIDELDTGHRALLNFGHTFGHALELNAGYGTLLHGEAVTLGMLMALDLSVRERLIDASLVVRVRDLFQALGLLVKLPSGSFSVDAIRGAMNMDKKTNDAGLQLILLNALGKARQTDKFQEVNLIDTLAAMVNDNTLS